jgi:hypothetical protein
MRRKITDLRERLSAALLEQFTREIARSLDRIREGIAPYSRFVRAERDSLREMEQELSAIGAALDELRARIDRQAA